jgi:hypothetical protein
MGAGMGRGTDGTSVSGGSGCNGYMDGAEGAFSPYDDGDSGPDRPRLQHSRPSTAHQTPSTDARHDGKAGASGAEMRFHRPTARRYPAWVAMVKRRRLGLRARARRAHARCEWATGRVGAAAPSAGGDR